MIPGKATVLVRNSLVRAIIGIDEEGVPAVRKLRIVHGKAMVLRGNVASASPEIYAGLVPEVLPSRCLSCGDDMQCVHIREQDVFGGRIEKLADRNPTEKKYKAQVQSSEPSSTPRFPNFIL